MVEMSGKEIDFLKGHSGWNHRFIYRDEGLGPEKRLHGQGAHRCQCYLDMDRNSKQDPWLLILVPSIPIFACFGNGEKLLELKMITPKHL